MPGSIVVSVKGAPRSMRARALSQVMANSRQYQPSSSAQAHHGSPVCRRRRWRRPLQMISGHLPESAQRRQHGRHAGLMMLAHEADFERDALALEQRARQLLGDLVVERPFRLARTRRLARIRRSNRRYPSGTRQPLGHDFFQQRRLSAKHSSLLRASWCWPSSDCSAASCAESIRSRCARSLRGAAPGLRDRGRAIATCVRQPAHRGDAARADSRAQREAASDS